MEERPVRSRAAPEVGAAPVGCHTGGKPTEAFLRSPQSLDLATRLALGERFPQWGRLDGDLFELVGILG